LGVSAELRDWAEQHFAAAQLGDPRRTRRLVDAAAAIGAEPALAFPQIFDWNALRGLYRLCDQERATLEAVQGPHWQQTRRAMRQQPLVLTVHDTSELDYSSHHHMAGRGQIGNEGGRGLLQHNSLAIVPQPRAVLGLAYQQLRARQPAPADESPYQRKRRPRESDLWRAGFVAAGGPPAGCCWVDVADRGGDDYETLRAARQVEHHFLVRATQDRVVFLEPTGQRQAHLLQYARCLPSQGSDVVPIRGRGGRPPRTAVVSLSGAPVWIPAPAGTAQRWSQPILAAWVIRIWEPQPPAGVKEPLEWILLCSLPSATLAELKERRDWYCCRWLVELFHDAEKNGCGVEERRFATAERMETCVALLSVVAVRVLQLRTALEAQPAAAAAAVGTAEEIDLVRQLVGAPAGPLTVRAFVRGVGRLGGFLGRRGDGEPGVRALWRGYQRLRDMVLGVRLRQLTLIDTS